MSYSHILWDFNGTLLDDVECGILSVNPMLKARGLPELSGIEAYRAVFRFPIIDYYRLLGLDIDGEGYDSLAKEWVKNYLENVKNSRLYDGAAALLDRINAAGIPQIILSATESNMLRRQLSSLGILGRFDEIIGLSDIYAYSKVAAAKSWAERVKPENALLIGDTPHDLETARSLGVDFAAVSQGHASSAAFGEGVKVFRDLNEVSEWLFG